LEESFVIVSSGKMRLLFLVLGLDPNKFFHPMFATPMKPTVYYIIEIRHERTNPTDYH
jgi:hypothetical protein